MSRLDKFMRLVRLKHDDLQKQRQSYLPALVVVWALSFWLVSECLPRVPSESGFDWLFWSANFFLAFTSSLGILYSFWWAAGSNADRRVFFFYLCFFLFLFAANATKSLVVVGATNSLMSQWLAERNSCELETKTCKLFVTSDKPEIRQTAAAQFFGRSGINLLGKSADGGDSMPPSSEALRMWDGQRQIKKEVRETNLALKRLDDSSQYILSLNLGVALLVFGIGGWWIGRPQKTSQ